MSWNGVKSSKQIKIYLPQQMVNALNDNRVTSVIESILAVSTAVREGNFFGEISGVRQSAGVESAVLSAVAIIADLVGKNNIEQFLAIEINPSNNLEIRESIESLSSIVSRSESFKIATLSQGQGTLAHEIKDSIEHVCSSIPRLPRLLQSRGSMGSVLRAARRHEDENLHSDFLAAILNSDIAGDFSFYLFDEIIKRTYKDDQSRPTPAYQFAKREVQLQAIDKASNDSGLRRLDILVHRPNEVMVIENKIWSSESVDQTLDYASAMSRSYRDRKRYCILLSPYGSSGVSREFRGLSYKQLYECIEKCLQLTDSKNLRGVEFYFEELADIIYDFYL